MVVPGLYSNARRCTGPGSRLAGHCLWVLVCAGACYWHGVGGFMLNFAIITPRAFLGPARRSVRKCTAPGRRGSCLFKKRRKSRCRDIPFALSRERGRLVVFLSFCISRLERPSSKKQPTRTTGHTHGRSRLSRSCAARAHLRSCARALVDEDLVLGVRHDRALRSITNHRRVCCGDEKPGLSACRMADGDAQHGGS